MKIFDRDGMEPIEECGGCGKKTEEHEWLDSVPIKGSALGLNPDKVKRFVCSKCGHVMTCFRLAKGEL